MLQYPDILLMDSTYMTNRYGIPLLHCVVNEKKKIFKRIYFSSENQRANITERLNGSMMLSENGSRRPDKDIGDSCGMSSCPTGATS